MPKLLRVFDEKPKVMRVFDEKPKVTNVLGEMPRGFGVILGAGQWTGFLLSLTYPTTGTAVQWTENNL